VVLAKAGLSIVITACLVVLGCLAHCGVLIIRRFFTLLVVDTSVGTQSFKAFNICIMVEESNGFCFWF
jgi:hypothetical protein